MSETGKIYLQNISILASLELFVNFVNTHTQKNDLIALTETWLRIDDTDNSIASFICLGYKFSHMPCTTGRGGGVVLFIWDD